MECLLWECSKLTAEFVSLRRPVVGCVERQETKMLFKLWNVEVIFGTVALKSQTGQVTLLIICLFI